MCHVPGGGIETNKHNISRNFLQMSRVVCFANFIDAAIAFAFISRDEDVTSLFFCTWLSNFSFIPLRQVINNEKENI